MNNASNSSIAIPPPITTAVPIAGRMPSIALLVFGPKKLPELGKGIGEGFRALRDGMKEGSAAKPEANTQAKTEDKPENKA